MDFIETIARYVPGSPSESIAWKEIDALFAGTCYAAMRATPQNPLYHGEGNVYVHTQMVCRELVKIPAFHALAFRQKTELFLAALLHDIGKVKTTRMEDGAWTSPHHALVGSMLVREFLWRDCGLCGSPAAAVFRETVCALVRYHMLPVHLMDRKAPERTAREIAAVGELAPDFSWALLRLMSEADVRGRIASDTEGQLAQVQMAGMLAEEAGCLHAPYPFADGFTRHAYLSGRNVQPDQALYNDTWGEVIMLSGLPGTGKDTWVQNNHPDLPMVSLDEIRKAKRIRQEDNQGIIIQAAQEQAREYLRKKQPFIWNATNLTKETRQKLIGLFERYGAGVRIVYLETAWNSRIERNSGRNNAVPESAVGKMLEKTILPTPEEAQTVIWEYT